MSSPFRQVTPTAVLKVIQLFETKNSRHSAVLCGKTGSAKSTTWKVLKGVLTRLSGVDNPEYAKVEASIGSKKKETFLQISDVYQTPKAHVSKIQASLHFSFNLQNLNSVGLSKTCLLDFY